MTSARRSAAFDFSFVAATAPECPKRAKAIHAKATHMDRLFGWHVGGYGRLKGL